MGKLQYDDQPSSNHTSVDYDASDFELACCGSDADCTPMPPQPGKFTQPWVRFAHASPTEEHKVDCVIELGGGKKEWDGFAYGVFSDWSGPFPGDTEAGNGIVKIYESTGGVRGALLATKSGVYLPPGPVLIALRGDWPPKSDTAEKQGSIEVTLLLLLGRHLVAPTSDRCVDCR